jgi:hypothetical protein
VSERPMIIRMTTRSRRQRRYDHRLRDLVQRTRDLTIATVPRSTARGWRGAAPRVVVGLEVTDLTEPELRQEILQLQRRVEKLAALLRLALALLHASGLSLSRERLPEGETKVRCGSSAPWIGRASVSRCERFSGSCVCRRVGFRPGADGRPRARLPISRPVLARR